MATLSTPPPNANPAALSLYAKLQKLSEDIQLQHSIINAQKETVLKSRQRAYDPQKIEPAGDPTHLVHTHAGTVLQHRAMLIKHYGLIQQHKQMVKEQGIHVQNLTSTLHNIQQETTMVDELMATKMAESKSNVITSSTSSPSSSSSPLSLQSDAKATRAKRKSNHQKIDSITIPEHLPSSPDIRSSSLPSSSSSPSLPTDVIFTNTNLDALEGENEEITITSTTSTTTTTTTSTTTETTTISSISTPSSTTTTSTTMTTTTANPSSDSPDSLSSSSSSSSSSCDSPMFDSPAFDPPSCGSPCAPILVDEIPLPLSP